MKQQETRFRILMDRVRSIGRGFNAEAVTEVLRGVIFKWFQSPLTGYRVGHL